MSPNVGIMVIRPHVSPEDRCGIIAMLPAFNLTLALMLELKAGSELSRAVTAEYEEHEGKDFYPALIESMAPESGSACPCVLRFADPTIEQGPVWERIREAIGATDPRKAAEGTIRHQFGNHDGIVRFNAVHAPDSRDATIKSARIWFGDHWNFLPKD